MKKNITVLFAVFVFAAVMVLLFGWGLPALFQLFLHNDYIRSVTLLVIFGVIVLAKRLTWSNYIVYVIAVFSLLGMLIDTSGNPLYNKPLEWIVSPAGVLQVQQDIDNYAPGQYAINDNLAILKPDGELVQLSTAWLYLYRCVQYLVIYSIAGTILGLIIRLLPARKQFALPASPAPGVTLPPELELKAAAELKRRAEAGSTRRVPPEEVVATALQLKKDGSLIPAIKLVRQHTDMSLGEAKQYVESL